MTTPQTVADDDKHALHSVTVGHDGINRCSCGDTWDNQIGKTELDRLLAQTSASVHEYTTVSLLATDRCDRCGGQAYYRAVLADSEVLLCNHHTTVRATPESRTNEEALLAIAKEVHDYRPWLIAQEKATR